jgi:hypothetical protein
MIMGDFALIEHVLSHFLPQLFDVMGSAAPWVDRIGLS